MNQAKFLFPLIAALAFTTNTRMDYLPTRQSRAKFLTPFITSLSVFATGRLVFQCITYDIHGFGFSDALLSCFERCRRAVLLLAHTHQISRKVVRL